ncbi:MAG: zinc-binding dehydrogenase [Planctomycetes bacterium]|nr:zinc-binding dehydrogenase [Planctomycetota bacterium]MBI3457043.1 zinc-binding dehydrogenase [Candidatus Rokubacteria bacterium]
MRAAILVAQNAPLEIGEVEVPRPEVGQVLVRVECSGICGKQLDEISGKRGHDPFIPHLLGHEGAGVVIEVGPGVNKAKAGDRVVLHWMKGLGINAATPQYRWKGRPVNAGWVTTFNEYAVVSENRLTPVGTDIDPAVAALLGCAVTTGLGIVFNDAALKPGQSLAVFGVGGVGLNVIQGAALLNSYPIAAVDLHDHKLEQAVRFGATHTVNARRGDLAGVLKEVSGGRGFDVAVDAVGDARLIETAYAVTSDSGRTILAGVPHHEERITIDSFPLHFGRRLFGSHGGDTQPDVDIPRYIELYKRGKLKLDEQIAGRHPLEAINEVLERVRRGDAVGRCVIAMA